MEYLYKLLTSESGSVCLVWVCWSAVSWESQTEKQVAQVQASGHWHIFVADTTHISLQMQHNKSVKDKEKTLRAERAQCLVSYKVAAVRLTEMPEDNRQQNDFRELKASPSTENLISSETIFEKKWRLNNSTTKITKLQRVCGLQICFKINTKGIS